MGHLWGPRSWLWCLWHSCILWELVEPQWVMTWSNLPNTDPGPLQSSHPVSNDLPAKPRWPTTACRYLHKNTMKWGILKSTFSWYRDHNGIQHRHWSGRNSNQLRMRHHYNGKVTTFWPRTEISILCHLFSHTFLQKRKCVDTNYA